MSLSLLSLGIYQPHSSSLSEHAQDLISKKIGILNRLANRTFNGFVPIFSNERCQRTFSNDIYFHALIVDAYPRYMEGHIERHTFTLSCK